MIGIGWGEMLVIAIVALIVVGPKDLPVMLRNLGRAMGAVRRMSNEFRREIDKAIAADEIKEIGKSISDPIRQTSADIRNEFQTLRDGKFEPTGRLKPSDPKKESVADEIRAQAGMAPRPLAAPEPVRAEAVRSATIVGAAGALAAQADAVGDPAADAPAAKPRRKPASKKPAPKKPAASKPGAKKPAVKKAETENAGAEADKPATRKRAPRKKPADSDQKDA